MNEAAAARELIAMLLLHPRSGVLIGLLLLAAWLDWRSMRIPNWLTVGGTAYALAYALFIPPAAQPGLGWALGGLLVGLVLLVPLYALRVMGAGDVKLMAMVGAFIGVPDILYAVLFTCIAGGVAALAFALWHRALGRMAMNVRDVVQLLAFAAFAGHRPTATVSAAASVGKLPYGISISAGTVAWLVTKQLGYA